MPKNWYLVNIAGNFFSNQPRLKGTVRGWSRILKIDGAHLYRALLPNEKGEGGFNF